MSERRHQDIRFGEQNHPDGTGGDIARAFADEQRAACDEVTATAPSRGTAS